MVEKSEKVVMENQPLIAYRPLKHNIKLEIPDDQYEVNSVEEENWSLQLPEDSVVMEGLPIIAYQPIPRNIKLEVLDDHQEENRVEEENWSLKISEDSIASADDTSPISDLQLNASLPSDDSGKSNRQLRDRQTTSVSIALEKGETLRDAEMMEELDSSEEEGSEYDQGSERSEHSSLDDLIPVSPKAGPSNQSKKLTNQALEASHRKKKKEGSNQTAQKKRFSCSKCERSYGRKDSLTGHMKNECGVEPQFTCIQCDRRFKWKHHLQRHLIRVHKNDRKQLHKYLPELKERQIKRFKCTKCDSSYKQKRSLDQHMKKECGVTFQCTVCKHNFKVRISLQKHLLTFHKIARHNLDKYGAEFKDRSTHPYKCDQCQLTYTRKDNLASHLKFHCGVEPSFPCPKCDCQCKRKSSLKLHLIEMHKVEPSQLETLGFGPEIRPDNPFKCDRCGTSFSHKQNL